MPCCGDIATTPRGTWTKGRRVLGPSPEVGVPGAGAGLREPLCELFHLLDIKEKLTLVKEALAEEKEGGQEEKEEAKVTVVRTTPGLEGGVPWPGRQGGAVAGCP